MDKKRTVASMLDQKTQAPAVIDDYVHAATSDNTRLAYQSDINHFLAAGGNLPATPECITSYLRDCAEKLNPNTIRRRMIGIRQWHKFQGHEDPTQHDLVKKTLSGIFRLHGQPQKKAAAIRLADVAKVETYFAALKPSLINARNHALFMLGFFGAFRRSELVNIQWQDVSFHEEGITIQLAGSKTDQHHKGETVPIPFGNEKYCPVQALIAWRKAAAVWEGYVFRRITKTGALQDQPICARHWNRVFCDIVKQAKVPNAELMSSHSLRRGCATEASRRGASLAALKSLGRWRATRTVLEYIEAGRQFSDTAVNLLFDEPR